MGIPENIDALLAKYGINTIELAEIAGVTKSTVSRWRHGGSIRQENLAKLVAYFSLTDDDILSTGNGLAAKESGENERTFVPVPLYGSVAAGTPIEMVEVEEMKEAPRKFVDEDHDSFLVRVRGNSMNKRIKDGDFALISPKHREPNAHDMFLVAVEGGNATIKHVNMLENGIELIPDSYDPTYRSKVFDFNEPDTPNVEIIGKVVWWCKEF